MTMSRDFQLPGRSPVIACDGMAATSHPLASLAAVDTLRAGGNAVDAAMAAVAVLCVVEPHMTGIGGDCFCLMSQPDKPVWGYNGSGRAGAKASDAALRVKGMSEIGNSIHAVTVPGALEAWEAILKAHGRFGLDRALSQAIKYAEGGFPVAARVAFIDAEDFARHRGEAVTPIASNYRGLDLVEIPPNGQGITAQVMLNIIENFDLAHLHPLGPERFHLVLEVARLAFAVRDTHIADAEHMRVAVADLLDKGFAKKLAAKIDMTKRAKLPAAPTPGSDTVYLTVVDRDRMAVSFINSLYSSFGLGICTEKSGIMLNNRGACFTLDAEHPNMFGPNKRPLHTIIPALAMRGGRCDMSFGVMGAHYQPMGQVQIVNNMLDYGMDVQQAIDAPRFFFEGEQTVVETGTPAATVEGLRARGHDVVFTPTPWGGAQTIKIDWDRGVLIAGSEGRKDGCALGY